MKPKIIIYDFDGVICDSVHVKTQAFVELYKGFGAGVQDRVRQYHIQHGGISRFEKIRYFQTELLGLPESEEEVIKLADRFAELVKHKVIASPYINGAKAFIEKCAEDCVQFICTGTPEFEILEITEKRQLTHLFSGIYGSPKSKSAIIQQILNETGVVKEDCVFFGDAMTDYNAALLCSIPFVGIENDDTVFPEGTVIIQDFNDPKLNECSFYESN